MLNVLKLTISLYLGGIVVSDVVSSLLLLLVGEFDIEIVLGIMGAVAFLGLFIAPAGAIKSHRDGNV